MADKSSTGAVHLTTLDLDVSKVFEQLNEIDRKIKEVAEEARQTPFTPFSGDGTGTNNPLGGMPESTEKIVNSTRNSIEKLIGGYLNLEKTITNFRATGNSEVFRNISSGIDEAINSLSAYSKTLEDGGKLTKESKKDISDLREQLSVFTNEVKLADNALLKNGESIDKQKNKIASLVESYNRLLTSLSKSGLDVSNTQFKSLQEEATKSAESARALYNAIKNGQSITDAQAKQFSDLNRTLSDYNVRLSELKTTAKLTGEGLAKLDEKAPDFNKSIKAVESLELQYRNFILSMSNSGKYTDEVFGAIPESARSAANELSKLTSTMKSSQTVTNEQTTRINQLGEQLNALKINLATAKDQAEQTGIGLKRIVDSTSVKNIESLNLQYKTFLNTLSKANIKGSLGKSLEDIKDRANEAAKQVEILTKEVQENGAVSSAQSSSYKSLSSNLTTLKGEFKDLDTSLRQASGGVTDFLNKLADKAKWLMAYQLIMLVQNAFSQVIDVIKNTEDSVVELQRVLNEDISDSAISKELYAIAEEFGQTFENVQEVAIRFAQTGQSWQETIDSTRATMLGLNTAELEVSTATEGLIAVMAQFGIKASDLESVIDKINITADSFPVTSEKIVAALQRAGGTASAFNMTLEETIATITTLAAQTGRSGENIGTALNSLIIFTSKTENLDLFASLSKQMDETVKKFRAGSGSIIDVWQQLGVEIEHLSKEQERALFDSTSFKEFSDSFEAEAAEYAASIQEIYGTAGAYRRNYLTVLLQDIGRVEKVMTSMADAEGYSLQENEKYMDTLTAKWNQLVIAAQELAVQFGEAGFLDRLKGLAEASTEALKLSKSIGGLVTIFNALATVFVLAKREKINNFFSETRNSVKSLWQSFKNLNPAISTFTTSMAAGEGVVKSFQLSMATLKLTLGDVFALVGIGITAFNAIKGAIDSATEAARENREELLQTGQQAESSAKSLYDAYAGLDIAKATGNKEEIEEAQKALVEFFGYQIEDIPILESRYGDLNTALQSLTSEYYDLVKVQAQQRVSAAEAKLSEFETADSIRQTGLAANETSKALQLLSKEGYASSKSIHDTTFVSIDALSRIPKNAEDAKEQLKELDSAIEMLKKNMTSKELAGDKVYQELVEKTGSLRELVNGLDDANSFVEMLGDSASEYFENMKNSIDDANNSLGNLSGEGANSSLINLEEELKTIGDAFDDLSGKVDSFQSAYASVLDIINEYNETGIMTADMLQTILAMEPEYIEMLSVQGSALSLNEDALMGLVNTNDVYLQQMVALKIAQEAETIATEMQTAAKNGLTAAEYAAGAASAVFGGQLYQAILGEIQGTNTSNELAIALQNVGNSAGLASDWVSVLTDRVSGMIGSMGSLLGLVNRSQPRTYYTPKISTPKKTSSKSNPEKDKLNAEIDAWKKKKEEVNDYYDSLEDNLKKQKEESDDYYDGLIENLKRVEKANDRINEQLDYYADRQKILTNLEQAQSRSGIEWREKEMEYQQELADLDEEWRRTKENWSIDDQVKELERLKEEAQNLVDAQIEQLKLLKESAVSEIEEAIEKLQEKLSVLTKSAANAASGIASGIASGLGEAESLFQGSLDDMQNRLDAAGNKTEQKVNNLSKLAALSSADNLRKLFIEPISKEFGKLAENMQATVSKASANSAKTATSNFMKGFISPISQQVANIMKNATSARAVANASISPSSNQIRISDVFAKSSGGSNTGYNNNQTVNLFANIGSPTAASSTVNEISSILTNPSKF